MKNREWKEEREKENKNPRARWLFMKEKHTIHNRVWGGINGKTININIKTNMLINIDAKNEGQYFLSFIKK